MYFNNFISLFLVCENGTVNQEGNTYFHSGPSSVCVNGMQRYKLFMRMWKVSEPILSHRYIRKRGGGVSFATRGVFCQQLSDQINGTS